MQKISNLRLQFQRKFLVKHVLEINFFFLLFFPSGSEGNKYITATKSQTAENTIITYIYNFHNVIIHHEEFLRKAGLLRDVHSISMSIA